MKVAYIGWIRRGVCCFTILTLAIIIICLLSQADLLDNVLLLRQKVEFEAAAACTRGYASLSSINGNENQDQCVDDYFSEYRRNCRRFLLPKAMGSSLSDIIETTVKLCPCIPSVLCRYYFVLRCKSMMRFIKVKIIIIIIIIMITIIIILLLLSRDNITHCHIMSLL